MGTRADFYIGTDPETMEYLGSIAYDGYDVSELDPPKEKIYLSQLEDLPKEETTVLYDENGHYYLGGYTHWPEGEYRSRVLSFLEERDDGSLPDRDGWPWPWEDSGTSDFSYTLSDGKLLVATGYPEKRWYEYPLAWNEEEYAYEGPSQVARFPNMKSIQKVTFGSRSGVLVLGVG